MDEGVGKQQLHFSSSVPASSGFVLAAAEALLSIWNYSFKRRAKESKFNSNVLVHFFTLFEKVNTRALTGTLTGEVCAWW